jgi:uncharacterized repeat protein (TIGR03803 family)
MILALVLAAAMQAAAQRETILHEFPTGQDDGVGDYAGLVRDAAGNLYGATASGGSYGVGTVYMLSPRSGGGWSETILHEFNNNYIDGGLPLASVVLDAEGNVYGTTRVGGAFDLGTVYEISPKAGGGWYEKVLHSFSGSPNDGNDPFSPLVIDSSGNLYGTTIAGGESNEGIVFQMKPMPDGSWDVKILHNFPALCCREIDGSIPYGGLTLDKAGNLYGTTIVGGASNGGVVFELSPTSGWSWAEKVLHSFGATPTDGYSPYAGVTLDSHGNLYGTTTEGGNCPGYGCGTVFELIPTSTGLWHEGILHNFTPGQNSEGGVPYGGVVLDGAGNLYGTTTGGGAYNGGIVFELSPLDGGWNETILYAFDLGVIDGMGPHAGVILDARGNIYGTTVDGGTLGGGVVFEITP